MSLRGSGGKTDGRAGSDGTEDTVRSGDQLFSAPLLIQFLTIVISTLPSGEPIGILDPTL